MSAKLINQRLSHQRSVLRLENTVDAFDENSSLSAIEATLDLLEDYWDKFQTVQIVVEEKTKEEEMDEQIKEMQTTETSYLKSKATLKELHAAKQPASNQNNPLANAQRDNNAKLPKLEVPKFDGTFNNWATFRDLFTSMVRDQPNLTNGQKLQYLKPNVFNEAAEIVSEYKITDANFETAWTALEERYENKRLQVKSHLNMLFNQPNMASESSVSLRLLLRTTQKCLRSLKSLGGPVDTWDWLLIHMVVIRLDPKTRRYWELTHTTKDMPTWQQLITALENRCNALESDKSTNVVNKFDQKISSSSKTTEKKKGISSSSNSTVLSSVSSTICSICEGSHDCAICKEFLEKSLDDRLELANKHKLCYKSPNCSKCKKRHHDLLHNPTKESPRLSGSLVTLKESRLQKQVLLSTALVKVRSSEEIWIIARAFLDSGSQSSVITEDLAQRLKLKRYSCDVSVSAIGGVNAGTCRKQASVQVKSCMSSLFQLDFDAVIMKRISANLPNKHFDISKWTYIKGLKLADDRFNEPGKIDLLIGGEYYLSLLKDEPQKYGPVGCPVAQSTVFGWILSGSVISSKDSVGSQIFSVTTHRMLENVLSKFWEIEEIPNISTKSVEDEKCEQHFEDTYVRNVDGRFIVKLPFNEENLDFGESRATALQRFGYLERRFAKNTQLRQDYVDQINELKGLNHIKQAKKNGNSQFYLPHHAVIKPSRSTTKMRIVFDAAVKSSNGVSLNDRLMVGPCLQKDLLQILIRFRSFRIVVTADIEKMFRQILVEENDQRYQKFLWRERSEDSIQEFQLSTVVFGTSSAPFLAVKVLQKLAELECEEDSKTKSVIFNDFYMDDLLSGGDNSKDVIQLVSELQEVLNKGKFPLRKWISNDENVLQSIDNNVKAFENIWNVPFQDSCKALGLRWHPGTDKFGFKVQINADNVPISKRSILSVIASLYDPLGLLAPTVILAKLLLQKLWRMGVNWDDPVSDDFKSEWIRFHQNLLEFDNITVPRWLGSYSTKYLELHGFCDASDDAYSAIVYARTKDVHGNYYTNIVIAKTRVAPIKKLSTPKLELCGSVLLTRLLKYVVDSLKQEKLMLFAWCDNTAVLDWLRKQPINWKTFVANRTSEIQTTLPSLSWRYVPSEENPADCASRGVDSTCLKNHKLWWNGPSWLRQDNSYWPNMIPPTNPEAEKEAKKLVVSGATIVYDDQLDKLAKKFSSLNKLKRVVAYFIRFIDIAKGNDKRNIGAPTVLELEGALKFMIKLSQHKHFPKTLAQLKSNKSLTKKDPLLSLNPFIGSDDLVRVGGRLSNSSLSYDEKHPIILPQKDPITHLIIDHIHLVNFHGGPNLMLSHLHRNYWIVAAKRMIKKYTRNCFKCCRVRGLTSGQIMGNLPSYRVTPCRAFLKSAVDYAGPIQLKVPTVNKRRYDIVKGYIAVFVCMVTKSIHLEAVSDQTSQAFLSAYKRFVARRGNCRELRSDNGTNFVGAKNELADLWKLLHDQVQNELIRKVLANDGTDWYMNPPYTPHFNGLAEAAVKSAKYHLKRVLSSTPFTFEEMITILCQIEAILNSRPIIPRSDDVNDLNVLTPGHFLIGEPLTAIPEPNLKDIKLNRLDRYQLMQRQVQEFWVKWKKDYLVTLQQRTKWKSPVENLKIGQLVTIKDDETPPTKWLMARVMKIKPGSDNRVRVAELKTVTVIGEVKPGNNIRDRVAELKSNMGIIERAVHNLCVLPTNDDEEDGKIVEP